MPRRCDGSGSISSRCSRRGPALDDARGVVGAVAPPAVDEGADLEREQAVGGLKRSGFFFKRKRKKRESNELFFLDAAAASSSCSALRFFPFPLFPPIPIPRARADRGGASRIKEMSQKTSSPCRPCPKCPPQFRRQEARRPSPACPFRRPAVRFLFCFLLWELQVRDHLCSPAESEWTGRRREGEGRREGEEDDNRCRRRPIDVGHRMLSLFLAPASPRAPPARPQAEGSRRPPSCPCPPPYLEWRRRRTTKRRKKRERERDEEEEEEEQEEEQEERKKQFCERRGKTRPLLFSLPFIRYFVLPPAPSYTHTNRIKPK